MIDEYERMLRKNFPTRKVTVKTPTNPKYTADDAVTYNFPLVQFNNNIGVKGRYVRDKTAYLPIFNLSKEHIAAFLSGMFDGDGTVDISGSLINIAIFDPDRVKNTQLLMKRLGIDSKIKISQQWITPPFSNKKILSNQYSLEIAGQKDLKKFITIVGSRHPDKLRDLNKMMNGFKGKNQITSKYNYAPIACTNLLKDIRKKLAISLERSGFRNIIWALENGRARTSINKLKEILDAFGKLNADLFILPEYKEILTFLKSEYNLDIIAEQDDLGSKELLELNTNNRILTDNGIVLDE